MNNSILPRSTQEPKAGQVLCVCGKYLLRSENSIRVQHDLVAGKQEHKADAGPIMQDAFGAKVPDTA